MIRRWWPVALLALGAVWICLEMWRRPWWGSHENIWYPVRVTEYVESWRGGGWYPRWCPDLYGGYGYPFFNYYAPGVYFAGAIFSAFTDSANALKIVIVLMSVVGAVGVFGALRAETDRIDAAIVGAALYVFFPYRCGDLYIRGDLAEYSAYCLAPCLLWAYRSISRNPSVRWAVAAALIHAAMLMTHTIIGMFTTELCGLYVLVVSWRQKRPAWLLVAAIGFAMAIAAVYIGPALLERKLVHLDRISAGRYQTWRNALHIKELLHDPLVMPGLAFGAAALAWLVALALPWTRAAARKAAPWWLATLGLLFLLLPYARFFWHVVPFGREVQFPWRLLGFIGLFSSVGTGILWAGVVPKTRWIGLAGALAIAAALPFLLSAQRAPFQEDRVVPADPIAIRAANATTVGMDEYLPRTVPHHAPERRGDAWLEGGPVFDAERVDGLTFRYRFALSADAHELVLGVFAFPGWKLAAQSGPAPLELATGADGLLRLRATTAGTYDATIHFGSTPVRTIAAVFSLLALIALWPAMRRIGRRA